MADWFRKAGEIWGQADRALGGWLPGGGTASPVTRAAQQARHFAGERLAAFRDQRFVPALDTAMQQGTIPADVGMYGRYLTGTRVPLTKIPADVKQAEQQYAQHFQGLSAQGDTRTKKFDELRAEQQALGLDLNKDYSRSIPNQIEREKITRYNEIEKKIMALDPDTISSASRPQFLFDPSNYATSGYSGTESAFYSKGQDINKLRNTLGQYSVQDGVITDRYDFGANNSWTGDQPFEHGGAFGQSGFKQDLATQAGRVSQRLGLIKPGSGYDIKFRVR